MISYGLMLYPSHIYRRRFSVLKTSAPCASATSEPPFAPDFHDTTPSWWPDLGEPTSQGCEAHRAPRSCHLAIRYTCNIISYLLCT